jgi:hypothetical protein
VARTTASGLKERSRSLARVEAFLGQGFVLGDESTEVGREGAGERRHAGSFLRAYLIGFSITSLFAIANGLIQVLRYDGLDLSSAEGKTELVVLSMAPILTAIPSPITFRSRRPRWARRSPSTTSAFGP